MRRGLLELTVLVLFLVFAFPVHISGTGQPDGFVSIDCGRIKNSKYTDPWTNITWEMDDDYIDTGLKIGLKPNNNYDNFNWDAVQTVRYFPPPGELSGRSVNRTKNCYVLPAVENERYLIRSMFYFANLEKILEGQYYRFNVSVDGNLWRTIVITQKDTEGLTFEESVVTAKGDAISVCLIDIGEGAPFISSLELRPLQALYAEMAGDNFLVLIHRLDCTGYHKPPIRYPDDPFDRLWRRADMFDSALNYKSKYNFNNISTSANTSGEKPYVEYPPDRVMQTAWLGADMTFQMLASPSESATNLDTTNFISMFYVWDFQEGIVGSRDFSIYMDDEKLFDGKLGDNKLFWKNHTRDNKKDFIDSVWRINTSSPNEALLNAFEFYAVYARASLTYKPDVSAVKDLQDAYLVTQTNPAWTGDPCQPVPWDWLQCDTSRDPPRVTHVNLSHVFNEFNDSALTLPPSFKNLTALTHLSLDNNNLTGEIPWPDLSFLKGLQVLHLEGNRLSGPIPDALAELSNLTELYLQKNNLSGSVPAALQKKDLKFLAGCNPLLEGLTPEIDSCGVVPAENLVSSPAKKQDSGWSTYVTVLLAVLGCVLLLGLLLVYKLRTGYLRKKEREIPWRSGSSNSMTLRKNQTRCFTLDEVKSATNNFDSERVIGEGGFGRVYYGKLNDGLEVAVKVNSETSNQGPDEFYNEVNILSRVHHRNLVSLVGYCQVDLQKILIYPFLAGKTLRDHLYGTESLLDWRKRLEIALDAARGLCYLHKDCTPVIVHRDVKSSNILLDTQLRAKVADFGISRSTERSETGFETTTRVFGTMGYLDPEYSGTRRLTLKSDVYSFGVVLLEIITGRPPINSRGPIDRAHWHLIDWCEQLIHSGNIADMVDPVLGKSYTEEAMRKVAEVAMQSVEPTSCKRITMEEVVTGLTEALALELQVSPRVEEDSQQYSQSSSLNTDRSISHERWQRESSQDHTSLVHVVHDPSSQVTDGYDSDTSALFKNSH